MEEPGGRLVALVLRGLRAVCPLVNGEKADWATAVRELDALGGPPGQDCPVQSGFELLKQLVEVHRRSPDQDPRITDAGIGAACLSS
ncbi:hypothetical protein [Kitasatospora sp. NPDC097691]|uniref:hypothetical protein n=1 Tax=Kitasatospora sp. NPDC097691 TaxID=3157231 RepID=UPI00332A170A